jgi:carbon storage regulator
LRIWEQLDWNGFPTSEVRNPTSEISAIPRIIPLSVSGFPICFDSGFNMLVVTRKKDEKLIIGNEIEIQVLRIGRDNVRLGIKAPAHISIYRYEIYEAIKNENVSAVTSQIPDKDTLEKISKAIKAE